MINRALDLAENGLYTAAPNPRVGCVIARDGVVVGEGWHRRAGEAHAETIALSQTNGDLQGAEVFVSLEPCAHQGRTPSCAETLAKAKPKTVTVATLDPNPLTAGKGLEILKSAGVKVAVCDVGGGEARRAIKLNAGFFSRMIQKRPWVRIKTAASLDGKTALAGGESQWLTGESARAEVHKLRARSCAVLTGVGTAEKDDPQLTVRAVSVLRQPLRVLVDSSLRAPPTLKMFNDGGKTLIATCEKNRANKNFGANAEVVRAPGKDGKTDLPALLAALAEREINEVTIEAGRKLCGAFLAEGLVDELVVYIAPLVLGDDALPMFATPPPPKLAAAARWTTDDVKVFAPGDVRVVYTNPESAAALARALR